MKYIQEVNTFLTGLNRGLTVTPHIDHQNSQSIIDGIEEAVKSFKLSSWMIGQLTVRIPIFIASIAIALYLFKQARVAKNMDGTAVDKTYRIVCAIALPFSLIPALIALVKWY